MGGSETVYGDRVPAIKRTVREKNEPCERNGKNELENANETDFSDANETELNLSLFALNSNEFFSCLIPFRSQFFPFAVSVSFGMGSGIGKWDPFRSEWEWVRGKWVRKLKNGIRFVRNGSGFVFVWDPFWEMIWWGLRRWK